MSDNKSNNKKNKTRLVVGVLVAAAFIAGYMLSGNGMSAPAHDHGAEAGGEQEVLFWTCSMHPQIKEAEPGLCPICAMELIPVYEDEEADDAPLSRGEIRLSERARALANVRTSAVERLDVKQKVRLSGKIEYDETRVGYITSWVKGRIDKLHVDYTGAEVEKGAPLAEVYSPELIAAQEELIQALRAHWKLKDSSLESIRDTSLGTVRAAREKLRLLGLTKDQIRKVERTGAASEHVVITAPLGGTVIHKNANEGIYVNRGERIYTIADLGRVWAMFDAFESDLAILKKGQKVKITSEAFPAKEFRGEIAFLDPFLDKKARAAKVRVEIDNPEGLLKPEMLVIGEVVADVSALAMEGQEKPLVIPDSAPLITGERAVVYVADPEREGVFEGREIELGPRAGDYFVVTNGLHEGERVVVNGAFKIDSAMQIKAKPSMMNPEGGGPMPGHQHGSDTKQTAQSDQQGSGTKDAEKKDGADKKDKVKKYDSPIEFRKQLDKVYETYYGMHYGLAHDDLAKAKKAVGPFMEALGKVDMKLVEGEAHMEWMKLSAAMKAAGEKIKDAHDIAAARTAFKDLSENAIVLARSFGAADATVIQIHCPMAFDNKGADWLQNHKEVENPWYGSMMFRCGDVVEVISKGKEKKE